MHNSENNQQPWGDFDVTFEEKSFWDALGRGVRRIGHDALEKVLLAYYVGIDPKTPPWARAALLAALGYFVLPVDAVPDVVPIAGFSDDIAVLASALAAVVACVDDDHLEKTQDQMRRWGLGEDGDSNEGDAPVAA